MSLEVYTVIWNICVALLFSFLLISSMLFIRVNQKVYLFYALYVLFLLLYISLRNPYGFFLDGFADTNFFNVGNWYVQIIYHFFYFKFGIEFLSVKKNSKSFYNLVDKVLIGILLVGTLVALLDFFIFNSSFTFQFYTYIHLPFILIFSIYFLHIVKKYQNPIYNFFLVAYIIYALFSLIAFYFSIVYPELMTFPVIYFYIGIILETSVLSYGIGYQSELIYKKNIAYERKLRVSEEILKKQLIEKNEVLNQRHLNEKLKRKQLRLENELNRLKVISLKNQMNSHFIFNTLNSIKSYITQKTPTEAVIFVTKFSKFIRFILEYGDVKASNLKRELHMIELYETLENMRFENTIHFDISVDKSINTESIKVPPMVFQPFVENAIWHGLSPKKGDKKLWIKVKNTETSILVGIKDNGVGRNVKNSFSNGIKKVPMGLSIVNQKLNHFNEQYSTNIFYEIIDLPKGTKIQITIPHK